MAAANVGVADFVMAILLFGGMAIEKDDSGGYGVGPLAMGDVVTF